MGYSIEGLKHGIERCDVNIASLKEAIARERATKKEYAKMIRDLAFAKQKMDEALSNVNIEVIRE